MPYYKLVPLTKVKSRRWRELFFSLLQRGTAKEKLEHR